MSIARAAVGFEPFTADCAQEAQNATAGAEALFGMGPAFQDEFAQGRGRRADAGRFLADSVDGPVSVATMA